MENKEAEADTIGFEAKKSNEKRKYEVTELTINEGGAMEVTESGQEVRKWMKQCSSGKLINGLEDKGRCGKHRELCIDLRQCQK